MNGSERVTCSILGAHIDAMTRETVIERLLGWAHSRSSRYVAIGNMHVVVTVSRDAAY